MTNAMVAISTLLTGLLGLAISLLVAREVIHRLDRLRRLENRKGSIFEWLDLFRPRATGSADGKVRIPSLSRSLVGLAQRRLPVQMDDTEKERWCEETLGDVLALPRRKRLWFAFNLWRKGAPRMPVGPEGAPRSANE